MNKGVGEKGNSVFELCWITSTALGTLHTMSYLSLKLLELPFTDKEKKSLIRGWFAYTGALSWKKWQSWDWSPDFFSLILPLSKKLFHLCSAQVLHTAKGITINLYSPGLRRVCFSLAGLVLCPFRAQFSTSEKFLPHLALYQRLTMICHCYGLNCVLAKDLKALIHSIYLEIGSLQVIKLRWVH